MADDEHRRAAPPADPATHPDGGAPTPALDVEALADRVYRLILAEARLEWARADPERRRATAWGAR